MQTTSLGKRPKIAVVGGGMTGLAAAYEIATARPDVDLVLIESKSRLGGNIETLHEEGFLLDGGPDSFVRTKPEAAALCEELGLHRDLIVPLASGHRTYIARKGKLLPLPAGMALAVPTRLGPLIETPLISFAGKLRILGDLFVSKQDSSLSDSDETVAAFLSRHFGEEVTHHLAGPLLGGIFAGDIEELSVKSTFPQLVELERSQGSLIRALFAKERLRAAQTQGKPLPDTDTPFTPTELMRLFRWLKRDPLAAPPSPFQSLARGMGSLVDALANRIAPDAILLDRSVRATSASEQGITLHLDAGETLDVDALVLATPAHVSSQLLRGWTNAPLSEALSEIPYVSTATVFFALERAPDENNLEGSGFIVPRGEGRMLASTFLSSKWAGRAPAGKALIRVFLGGAREPSLVEGATDEELLQLARTELSRWIGPFENVTQFARVFRWTRSNPQPTKGHSSRLQRINAELSLLPRLALASSAYDGVGISDCIRQGRAAANRVLSLFSHQG